MIEHLVEQTVPDLIERIWILTMFVMMLLNHQAMSVSSMLVAGFPAVATQLLSCVGSTCFSHGFQNPIMFLISCLMMFTTLGRLLDGLLIRGDEDPGHWRLQDQDTADAANAQSAMGISKGVSQNCLIEKRRLMVKSIKRLRNRTLGAALNIWRDVYEQDFELSNLQLRARFCWTYRTLAEGFRTWRDTTVHVRAECNRRAWSLQHWAYRQLWIAFDAWRQCLAKAQKGDLELRICTEDGIRFPITISTSDIDHCGYSLRYKSPFPLFGLPVAAIGACQSIRDACIQIRLLSQVELSLSCTCANSNLSSPRGMTRRQNTFLMRIRSHVGF